MTWKPLLLLLLLLLQRPAAQGKAMRHQLWDLGILDFLMGEMRFESNHPVVLPLPPQQQSAAPAAQQTPAHHTNAYSGRLPNSSTVSTSRRSNHQTASSNRPPGATSAVTAASGASTSSSSPVRVGRTVSSPSPSKRVPVVAEHNAEPSPDRGDLLHVPVSAPTSSSAASASPSPVRRALSLVPSPSANRASPSASTASPSAVRAFTGANRAPLLLPVNRPLNSLSSQFSSQHISDDESPTKLQFLPSQPRRSSDQYRDENSPLGISDSRPSPGARDAHFGTLDAPEGFVPTGDVNEDVATLIAFEVGFTTVLALHELDPEAMPASSLALCLLRSQQYCSSASAMLPRSLPAQTA